jgi:hypothetical protein
MTRTHVSAPYPGVILCIFQCFISHCFNLSTYSVYPREFVDMRAWVEGDDRILFGAQSINSDEVCFLFPLSFGRLFFNGNFLFSTGSL